MFAKEQRYVFKKHWPSRDDQRFFHKCLLYLMYFCNFAAEKKREIGKMTLILKVYSQRGNDSFPTREYYVPNVGTKIGI